MSNGKMSTTRLEAFSDGVIAIIVTVMVLQLTHPAAPTFASLLKQAPIFLSYALSFLVVAIMWVNHHHLIHAVREVTARLLWANLNLLFWMSLIPFVTDFMGRNPRAPFPVSLYGFNLAMCGFAFWLLRIELVRQYQHDLEMSEYHSRVQTKNLFSGFLYLTAGGLARLDLHSLLHLRADPGDVLSARKKAGGRATIGGANGKESGDLARSSYQGLPSGMPQETKRNAPSGAVAEKVGPLRMMGYFL